MLPAILHLCLIGRNALNVSRLTVELASSASRDSVRQKGPDPSLNCKQACAYAVT